jgi:hypothetical protein
MLECLGLRCYWMDSSLIDEEILLDGVVRTWRLRSLIDDDPHQMFQVDLTLVDRFNVPANLVSGSRILF